MLLRLALVAVLTVAGSGSAPAPPAPPTAEQGSTGSAATVVPPEPTRGAGDDVAVTEVEVVVPPVDPHGAPALAAPTPEGAVVADDVLGPDRVQTAVVEAGEFQTLGVTWPSGADGEGLAVQVRTRTDGAWSDWVPLPNADDAPDAGTADAERSVRAGTESLWVGDADAVQASFATTPEGGPEGLELALVDVQEVAEPAPERALERAGTTSGAPEVAPAAWTAGAGVQDLRVLRAAHPAPRVISRAEWGARAQRCAPDVASSLVGAVVHHTAGSNAYASAAEAARQIRADQAYHMDARGWCDLGYNFVVDKWGNIYEGRAGSLTQAVIGVHAGGFNTGTLGVAMLGEYSSAPSAGTREAVAAIIGWRLGASGVDPRGVMAYRTGAGENSRFRNQTVTLPRVSGHRDVSFTACPGNGGYAALPGIRDRAGAVADGVHRRDALARVSALYDDMLGRAPDPVGLQTWVALDLSAGPGAVASSLALSPEYVQRRIAEDYRSLLGRGPDAVGLATWSAEIGSGRLRQDDLRGSIIASDEYFRRSGGTHDSYVRRLYRDILQRDAAASEVSWWTAATARSGRGVAPTGVWQSPESARLRVHETYLTFLDRHADPTGLGTWGPYWQGHGEAALRTQIVSSAEYLGRSLRSFS